MNSSNKSQRISFSINHHSPSAASEYFINHEWFAPYKPSSHSLTTPKHRDPFNKQYANIQAQ
jgi:hypothetical protein